MIKVDFYSDNGYVISDEYPINTTLKTIIDDSKKYIEKITEITFYP